MHLHLNLHVRVHGHVHVHRWWSVTQSHRNVLCATCAGSLWCRTARTTRHDMVCSARVCTTAGRVHDPCLPTRTTQRAASVASVGVTATLLPCPLAPSPVPGILKMPPAGLFSCDVLFLCGVDGLLEELAQALRLAGLDDPGLLVHCPSEDPSARVHSLPVTHLEARKGPIGKRTRIVHDTFECGSIGHASSVFGLVQASSSLCSRWWQL